MLAALLIFLFAELQCVVPFLARLMRSRVSRLSFLPLFHGLRPLAAGTAFDASCHRMKALGTNRSRRNKAMNAGVHTDTIFA